MPVTAPPGAVTTTSTGPALYAGVVAVIWVAELTVKLLAALLPPLLKLTSVAPRKPVPVIVMEVPPAIDPLVGETAVTVGEGTGVGTFSNETLVILASWYCPEFENLIQATSRQKLF